MSESGFMDEAEARALLAEVTDQLRTESYPALVAQYIRKTGVVDLVGTSGIAYCVEVQGVWDSGRPGDVRIMAGIDDGHFRSALRPLTEDFVMAPDGSFLGE